MKITTNNSLNKLVQLIKAKLDELSQTVTNSFDSVNGQISTINTTLSSKPSINDVTPSATAVYSSSKVDELLASSGGKATEMIVTMGEDTYWSDGSAYIKLSDEYLTNKACIVDLVISNTVKDIEEYKKDFAQIKKASLYYSGMSTNGVIPLDQIGPPIGTGEIPNGTLLRLDYSDASIVETSSNFTLKVLLIDKESSSDNTEAFLITRAPVSSSSSTIYEFTSPVTLTSFTANSDEDIPYYADITNLSSYITDTNKIAVVNPDTSETNSTLLRYTEVIDGGSIRCYFAEQPTSYAIKSIEIRNASLVSVQTTALISFTIDGTSYQAEEGMTWGEWVNSSYDTGNFYTIGTNVCQKPGADVYAVVGAVSTSAITANSTYFTEPWR